MPSSADEIGVGMWTNNETDVDLLSLVFGVFGTRRHGFEPCPERPRFRMRCYRTPNPRAQACYTRASGSSASCHRERISAQVASK